MFYVDEPDEGLAGMIERGPTQPCHMGDEMCAFYTGGPCTAIPCTCETTGVCIACRPEDAAQSRRTTGVLRIP